MQARIATPEDICGSYDRLEPGCSGCERNDVPLVIVGEEPYWESRTAALCEPCAVAAVEAFRSFKRFNDGAAPNVEQD